MTRTANILCGRTVLECQYSLSDHLTSVGTDNVDSENSVCFLICNESVEKERDKISTHCPQNPKVWFAKKYSLYHAFSIEIGLGSRVCAKREASNIVSLPRRLNLLLRQTDPRGFRVCVHDAGNSTVVDVTVSLADELNGRDTFLLGLVRQHGAEGDIADHADMGDLGAVLLVDDDTATFVGLNADIFKAETGSIGAAADRDEDDVGVKLKI